MQTWTCALSLYPFLFSIIIFCRNKKCLEFQHIKGLAGSRGGEKKRMCIFLLHTSWINFLSPVKLCVHMCVYVWSGKTCLSHRPKGVEWKTVRIPELKQDKAWLHCAADDQWTLLILYGRADPLIALSKLPVRSTIWLFIRFTGSNVDPNFLVWLALAD